MGAPPAEARTEDALDEEFPMIVLPTLLARNRCTLHGDAPFSTGCLVSYIAGGRPTCPSCDEAIPRLLQAILAVGLDREMGKVLPRYFATAQARSHFYR